MFNVSTEYRFDDPANLATFSKSPNPKEYSLPNERGEYPYYVMAVYGER